MLVLASLATLISAPGGVAIAFGSDAIVCPDTALPACEAARLALTDAQSEVEAAAAQKALWTTAADALKEAQTAFLKGDYTTASRSAHTAIEQARLGVAQAQYPRFPLPSP